MINWIKKHTTVCGILCIIIGFGAFLVGISPYGHNSLFIEWLIVIVCFVGDMTGVLLLLMGEISMIKRLKKHHILHD